VGGGRFGRAVERRGLRRFCGLPSLAGADLVVTTHFLCARVLTALRSSGALRSPVAVCVTDVHPHAVWLSKGTDALLVAAESSRETAVRAGLPAERVHVTGIPIDRRFEAREAQSLARFGLGLPPQGGRPVVLVAGGGLGLGGIEGVVAALMRRQRPLHVAVICGRNAALRRSLEPLARDWRTAGTNEPSCSIEGFTTQMPRWMAAADLLVGKPGGLTTAEACAAGLPMVLLRPIPGQEERNAEHLCGQEAAVLRVGDELAADETARLAFDRAALDAMRAASARLGRPNAAIAAARAALSLVDRSARRDAAPWVGATSEQTLVTLPCVAG
jgi:processive 1,2-diacylglycerol beta-glucosyltransferase